MQIEVKESIPSPYAIFFLLSLFVGFITFALILRKRGVSRQIVMLDACLNIMLVLYLGMMFTLVVSGFKNFAFSSLGGALGIILSTFIMSKVTKLYAEALWDAMLMVTPLIYGISKLGCFRVGCCGGIPYSGPMAVTYHGERSYIQDYSVFPVQLLETIVFFILFLLSIFVIRKMKGRKSRGRLVLIILFAFAKFAMDYLRISHVGQILSPNQIVCVLIILVSLFLFFVEGKHICKFRRGDIS